MLKTQKASQEPLLIFTPQISSMHVNPILKNHINGRWVESQNDKYLSVTNPATTRRLAKVPAGCPADVDLAVRSALAGAEAWRKMPHSKRVGYLLKMNQILEPHTDELAEICTNESGKTFSESKKEIYNALKHLKIAGELPDFLKLDETSDLTLKQEIREPVGIGTCISPFNYPVMALFAFFPYALACGNTFIIKPSEKVPMTITRILQLLEAVHLPPGVLNLIHGGRETINTLVAHPDIKTINYIGSNHLAKQLFQQATLNGKRIQVQGGSNNPMVVMPDADADTAVRAIMESAFGCAGQRLYATSVVILVGEASTNLTSKLVESSRTKECGYGMDPMADVGPVISNESQKRIKNFLEQALEEGADLLLDGRPVTVKGFEDGYFLKPTILGNIKPGGILQTGELSGPILGLLDVATIEDAIHLINHSIIGNAASIFTQNESTAKKFRLEVLAGNIGINSAAPDPLANFPTNEWKSNRSTIEFFTKKKMVLEYWDSESSKS